MEGVIMRVQRLHRALVGATVLVALLAALVAPPAAAKEPSSTRATWSSFRADRNKLFETLAPAFVSCFKRRDSLIDPLSPIFHGCLDWHSAVHAAYSHHVLYRRTGKDEYLDLVQAQIAPQGISLIPAEEVYEQAKAPNYALSENPYGFGWFLVMARERELATGEKDFRTMADFAAEQMMTWFETRITTGDAQTYILNKAHPNYSWSLINLDVWGRYTKDEAILDAVHAASKPLLEGALDGLCPIDGDTLPNAGGFQPACLMRLAALAHIWGDKVKGFVTERLPKDLYIPPVTDPASCHAGGLNFTRAFALYQMYQLTGNTKYRDNYVELIRWHVAHPELYMGEQYLGNPDYLCYSHWVAQVGVRTISLSYDPRPPTPKGPSPLDG
jgi:hypothetical protein